MIKMILTSSQNHFQTCLTLRKSQKISYHWIKYLLISKQLNMNWDKLTRNCNWIWLTLRGQGTRPRRVERWELILSLLRLSASLWFFNAASAFSSETLFFDAWIGAFTSSPFSPFNTKDWDNIEPPRTNPRLKFSKLCKNGSIEVDASYE